jgi:c(7)-type cytochrome triheme protein
VRKAPVLGLTGLGLGFALFLLGCNPETRQRWLPYFFDGASEAGRPAPPPTRRVRQDLQREVEALRRENADLRAAVQAQAERDRGGDRERPAERARTWAEAQDILPRDAEGAVDWSRAIVTGVIRPRPGLDPAAPAQASFDMDVELARGHRFFSATFRHASHTRWLACGSCHPSPFGVAPGTPRPPLTMAALRAGRACGACHGPVVFGVESRCAACHSRPPATDAWQPPAPAHPLEGLRSWEEVQARLPVQGDTPDWERARTAGLFAPQSLPGQAALEVLDLDLERVPKEAGEDAKVTFRHRTHTVLLACDSCHPTLFEQRAGATPITMEQLDKGELCGACHGKVAFPTTACALCHPGLGG